MIKIFKRIFTDKKFYLFIAGGLLIFFIEYILTVFLTESLHIKYYFSYFFALFFGTVLLFLFHKKITFKLRILKKKKIYTKFVIIYLVLYFLNWAMVILLAIKINYLIAIPISNVLLFVPKYLINKKFVFV